MVLPEVVREVRAVGGQDGRVDERGGRPSVAGRGGGPRSGGRAEVPGPVQRTREPEGAEGEMFCWVIETRGEGGRNIW